MVPGSTVDEFARWRSGDERALGVLLDRLRNRLVLWAAARLGPALRERYEPEDVAQQILLEISRRHQEFRGDSVASFFAWVFRIGRSCIAELADHDGALKRQLPVPAPFSQTSPSARAERNEQLVLVLAAMALLSDADREVIVLAIFEERSTAELAELWGISEDAVRQRRFRALRALRRLLGRQNPRTPPRNGRGRIPPTSASP